MVDSPLASTKTRMAIGSGLVLAFVLGFWQLARSAPADVDTLQVGLWSVLMGAIGSLPTVALLMYLDRRDREPWLTVGLAYLWGAVVATGFALVLTTDAADTVAHIFDDTAAMVDTTRLGLVIVDWNALFDWVGTAFTAPLVEEAVKGLALLLMFALVPSVANGIRDGIIYGALVGLGFAIVESAFFVMAGFQETGNAPYVGQLVARFVFFGLDGHVIYTALFGGVLGMATQSTTAGWKRRTLGIVGGFVLAVMAHSASNAFGPAVTAVGASLLGVEIGLVTVGELWRLSAARVLLTYLWAYIILGYLVVRSGYWELSVCKTQLRREMPDTVTPDEYGLVEREGLWKLRRIPWLPRRRSRQLVRAQNRLAFYRTYLIRKGREPDADPVVPLLRDDIATIRGTNHRAGAFPG